MQPQPATEPQELLPDQPAVADVVPLRPRARARKEDAAAAFDLKQQQHAAAAFDALVRPLEAIAGRRLNGANRLRCATAFAAHPQNFRRLVSEALARGRVNPVGLLVRMVTDSDHEHDTPSPETVAERQLRRPPAARPHDDCAGPCGQKRTIVDVDRYLCEECATA
jgi:hypothetical protein